MCKAVSDERYNITRAGGETLIIAKYKGINGYKNQPRTQGYSLGHESAPSAWQGIIWLEKITENMICYNLLKYFLLKS